MPTETSDLTLCSNEGAITREALPWFFLQPNAHMLAIINAAANAATNMILITCSMILHLGLAVARDNTSLGLVRARLHQESMRD